MAQVEFTFGEFQLQPAERRLLRNGAEVAITGRGFDVLHALVRKSGEVVTKEELQAAVWGTLVVEEANLHVQVSQLRKAIGNDSIATIPRLGYRFVWPVDSDVVPGRSLGRFSRRLSIIVLPFEEARAPQGQEYFADWITDEVTTTLSKIPDSLVISNWTALAYKNQTFDLCTLARDLGVRYVLQGQLDRGPQRLDLNARLLDAETGKVLWSDRITVRLSDLRELCHDVVERLAGALDLKLRQEEAERSRPTDAEDPAFMDLVMRARCVSYANWSRRHYENSAVLFKRAWRMAPDSVIALCWHAESRLILHACWPGPDGERVLAECEQDLQRALALDAYNGHVHHALSVLRQQQYRLDEALEFNRRAMDLWPSCVHTVAWRAALRIYTGRSDLAIDDALRALSLSPRDPHQWAMYQRLGQAAVMLGDHERAVPWLKHSLMLLPFWGTSLLLAAARAGLGEIESAKELLAQVGDEGAEYMRRARLSQHPEYLRQQDVNFIGPLVAGGLIPATSGVVPASLP